MKNNGSAAGTGYGNEVKFGDGKAIHDGMDQSPLANDVESLGDLPRD